MFDPSSIVLFEEKKEEENTYKTWAPAQKQWRVRLRRSAVL